MSYDWYVVIIWTGKKPEDVKLYARVSNEEELNVLIAELETIPESKILNWDILTPVTNFEVYTDKELQILVSQSAGGALLGNAPARDQCIRHLKFSLPTMENSKMATKAKKKASTKAPKKSTNKAVKPITNKSDGLGGEGTITRFFNEAIIVGKDSASTVSSAQAKFPDKHVKSSYYSYYKYKLSKAGLLQ